MDLETWVSSFDLRALDCSRLNDSLMYALLKFVEVDFALALLSCKFQIYLVQFWSSPNLVLAKPNYLP